MSIFKNKPSRRGIYKLKPDPVDSRDRFFVPRAATLPSAVDLRAQCPPIYDQGQLGSCTANAIGAALDFMHASANNGCFFGPSRLFIYYNERSIEGTVSEDAGACIRDGIKSVNAQGACRENPTWPYDVSQFATKPTAAAYAEAEGFQAVTYQRVITTPINFKAALAQGLPVVFGIQVYSSFESQAVAQTGEVPMPKLTEQLLGGHAVCAVGYDDNHKYGGFLWFGGSKGAFLVRNSWGPDWGKDGYFWLPYAFVENQTLTSDAWAISKAE